MAEDQKSSKKEPSKELLPQPLTAVVVHCDRYSCLGFLDQDGIWRSRFSNQPLDAEVIGWQPV